MRMKQEIPDQYASERNEVFSAHVKLTKAGHPFMNSFALLRVIEELLEYDVKAGDAIVYLEMVWIAGEHLDFPVRAEIVGEKLCRTRQSVRISILKLVDRGVIKQTQVNTYLFTKLSKLRLLKDADV